MHADFTGARENSLPSGARAGNVVVAEIEAREVGRLDLREALELTALIAVHDRLRFDRYRVRCLHRCPSALVALGGPRHDEALALLCAVIT